jgi:predicted phage terminase large subunit-like protein
VTLDPRKIPYDSLWKLLPHTFAKRASLGSWIPGPPHEMISQEIAEGVGRGNARIVFHMPPGHGKSTLISKWVPLWLWELFPDRRIGFSTYADAYAAYWGEKVIDETRRSHFVSMRPRGANPSTKNFLTAGGGEWFAKGAGGGTMGRRYNDLIIDDPIPDADAAFSHAHRRSLVNWYEGVAERGLEPGGNVFLLMQRWGENDFAAYLISRGFRYVCLPALAEAADPSRGIGPDPLGRKPGEALWPQRWPRDVLEAMRDGDPKTGRRPKADYFWSSQYQGRPTPLKGRVIDVSWLRSYDCIPGRIDEVAIFADMNVKEEKGVSYEGQKNDFTVYQAWARCGADLFLLPGWDRFVGGFTEQLERFAKFCKNHPKALLKGIENKANGPALQNVLQHKIPGIVLVEPRGGKVQRVMAAEPMLKAGNVHVPSRALEPRIKEFIDECRSFPGGSHDDQVDTMSLALSQFEDKMATAQDLPTVLPTGFSKAEMGGPWQDDDEF